MKKYRNIPGKLSNIFLEAVIRAASKNTTGSEKNCYFDK